MNLQEFTEIMQEAGLRMSGTGAYGLMGGYPVSVMLNNGKAGNFAQVILSLEPGAIKMRRKELQSALKPVVKGTGGGFVINEGAIFINLPVKGGLLGRRYESVKQAVPQLLQQIGLAVADLCPLCQQPGCDSYADVKSQYRPVHSRCVRELSDRLGDEVERNEMSGSYGRGIIGAILGGFVGLIPSLFSIWFLETIYSLLFALIPLCAYYGYKKLGGKMNKGSVIATCVVSIIAGLLIDPLIVVISLVQEGYPLEVIPLVFGDSEFLAALLPEMLKSLMFIALGIFIVWSQISRTTVHQVRTMEQIMGSMQPIPSSGYAPAEPAPILSEETLA